LFIVLNELHFVFRWRYAFGRFAVLGGAPTYSAAGGGACAFP
jgi:hypothetical protein